MDENRTECKLNNMLHQYQEPKKNQSKKMIYNFTFDMFNIIPIRVFGSKEYVFIKYDKDNIKSLDQLRNKIQWSHYEKLDESLKNKELDEKTFREHL